MAKISEKTTTDEYLLKYKDNTLYIGNNIAKFQGTDHDGRHITYCFDINERRRLVCQSFIIDGKISQFKIRTLLKNKNSTQWRDEKEVSHLDMISINNIGINVIDNFLTIIKDLNLQNLKKGKVHIEDINNIDIGKEELKNILQHKDKIKIIVDNNLLSEDLTKAVILKQRSESIAELEKSINESKEEGWFQKFFEKSENHWILGNAIDFTFVHIESKYDLPTSDGQRKNQTDFISQNLFGYCSVVEIKGPKTPLMKKKEIKSDPPSKIHGEKRTHVYIPDDDLIVGVSQVIHYQNRGVERSDSEGTKKFASNASGLVVIGNSKELDQNEQVKRSFELYHNSIKNVTIMTYDELLKRAKQAIGYYSNP